MQVSGITDWIESLAATARSVGQWVGAQVSDRLRVWNADVKKFTDALAAVQMSEGSSAALRARRLALIETGTELRDKIRWVQNQVAALTGSVYLNGLGVLPAVVPAAVVAAIIGATALIYKFVGEVSAYLAEERRVRDAIAAGADPAKARAEAQAATRGAGGGLFDDISDAIMPIALVAAAAYILGGRR